MTRKSVFRGLLSFVIILLMMPLGHAFVVLMGRYLDRPWLVVGATLLGLAGIVFAVVGNRLPGRAMRILAGACGAVLFWGAWVEFIFICYGQSLSVPPLIVDGEVYTKPEYLMMPVTIPFAVVALLMYTFMAHTHWTAIKWLRRILGVKPVELHQQADATGAFFDLFLLIWWAYLILLVEFDPSLLGARHPVTLAFSMICLTAGIILLIRSLRAPDWASALRQSIVTVCVLWTFIEVMIKLRLFTEIWIYPERYLTEMILTAVAFIVAIALLVKSGHRSRHLKGPKVE